MDTLRTNDDVLTILSLSDSKKALFKLRYLDILENYKGRAFRYAVAFHTLRVIVGVGSLFVPALLSIQEVNKNQNSDLQVVLYWGTWILSLMVTMSNGMFTLFKVDKKYYFIHTILEQLRSEGWQFLMLTGRYSLYRTIDISGTHDNAFALFCHMVEKIKMHQVEEEYFKLTDDYIKQEKTAKTLNNIDTVTKITDSSARNTDISVLPKTPQNPINLDTLPPDLRIFMQSMIDEKMNELNTVK